jgi:hypothetical protein
MLADWLSTGPWYAQLLVYLLGGVIVTFGAFLCHLYRGRPVRWRCACWKALSKGLRVQSKGQTKLIRELKACLITRCFALVREVRNVNW